MLNVPFYIVLLEMHRALFSILVSTLLGEVHGHPLVKRTVLDFQKVISCQKNTLSPYSYLNYGCFCGGGNYDTNRTVDAIDECCKTHDECYYGLRTSKICDNNTNTAFWCLMKRKSYCIEYEYECKDEVPVCLDDKMVGDKCAQQFCRCDVNAAQCFAKHNYPYGNKPDCPYGTPPGGFISGFGRTVGTLDDYRQKMHVWVKEMSRSLMKRINQLSNEKWIVIAGLMLAVISIIIISIVLCRKL